MYRHHIPNTFKDVERSRDCNFHLHTLQIIDQLVTLNMTNTFAVQLVNLNMADTFAFQLVTLNVTNDIV